MQRYQTEDEHRKAMRAKINKTIKRGRRRKRIIRRLRKAVPGICIGVLIAGMGAWCIAAPLPDPDDYEPYRFQAENGQWYTQEEYEQMSRERDAYHQREREEAEKEAQLILPTEDDAKAVEAASSLKNAATGLVLQATKLAAQADRIMHDLYDEVSSYTTPVEDYLEGQFEDAEADPEAEAEEEQEDAE